MKKLIYEFTYNDKQFICEVYPDAFFHGRRAEVMIYEKRNSLFFRKKLVETRFFWVDHAKTIKDGARLALGRYLKEEEEENNKIVKKWADAIEG